MSQGCYLFTIRAHGTNSDGQPVTHLETVRFTVATTSGSGQYVDIIGFAVFEIDSIGSNDITATPSPASPPTPTTRPSGALSARACCRGRDLPAHPLGAPEPVELEYSDKNSRRSKLYIGVGLIVALLVAGTVFVDPPGEQPARSPATPRCARWSSPRATSRPARRSRRATSASARSVADPTNETAFATLDEVLGRVSRLGGRHAGS